MKTKNLITLLFIGLFSTLFTGCAQTTPTPSTNNIYEASHIEGDTISIDENENISEYETEGYITESGMVLGNTSKDGFQSTYFEFDKYTISTKMQPIIERNIQLAQTKSGKIKIEGNCDSYGTEEYNYALGLKRAKSIKDSLINGGIAEDRIILVSMGEANPACTQSLAKNCVSKNRRADLSIAR